MIIKKITMQLAKRSGFSYNLETGRLTVKAKSADMFHEATQKAIHELQQRGYDIKGFPSKPTKAR